MLPYLLSVVTALGWVGAIVGLVAYFQVSRGRWAPNSIQFQAANLCATSMLFLVAAVHGVWPSVAANVAWMVIGAQAVLMIVRARRDARRGAKYAEQAYAEPAYAESSTFTETGFSETTSTTVTPELVVDHLEVRTPLAVR
ncbi:hypothetical protein BCE75_101146 [Isoptericola sp. CG 20/1183]|uniref:CBU-0592-like domain-containing protein n=1 Tax=Isoptericola halotolerans TaxID=300560 RepID=A0ABX5EJC3_9MICO|nr:MULTISPECIES: hypothetical protein [Isoptericola]MCK0116090.1 hypothetical protein [Isoptericola sp. S6320L]PRZ08732.1 hypothetical protein BCL65_102276 [Isoptericola halotolerans]PRZ10821.1 hypothetical protein BCE75_101146 [Isoptericola sp. CG 20/1183]